MRSRAFKATGVAATVLALFFMLGGHWFALQSVAWARMFSDFSKSGSFTEALEKTFDGEHPCKMCLRIREGQQQEQRDEEKLPLVKTEKSPEWICDVRGMSVPSRPTLSENAVGFVPQPHPDFLETPPSPPPRFFTAVL